MSDTVITGYSAALDAMRIPGPKPLHPLAAMLAGDPGLESGDALLTHLRSTGPQDPLRIHLELTLAGWDNADANDGWMAGTARNTAERRDALITAFRLNEAAAALFADLFPYAAADAPTVIAEAWQEWRTPQRRTARDFYWAHYRRHLLDKGWDPGSISSLDEATEEIIRRVSDPTRPDAYQAKGLVIGHVQSGKTANFTGFVAKAIDAGYRLVIVLTGTVNMLRTQTQRRLDMELSGRENLEAEISKFERDIHDYHDDPDWHGDRFVRHGARPSVVGYPDIVRLTTRSGDFRRLKQGHSALEFERRERHLPFYDEANLYAAKVRLIVAKKNSTVLRGLVADLGRNSDWLEQVPALIIDDESDQASVNTTSPKKWREGGKERTAINMRIAELLRIMPRAQYVGYTATPYANIFIDPGDAEDIFPRDFLVSLRRPPGYMGPDDFHDLDAVLPLEERTYAGSNEKAHVRYLDEEPQDSELRTALDMFMLTAAVKAHRERLGRARYRHHTMLVHEAMHRDVHRTAAAVITGLWNTAGYHTAAGLARLRDLYQQDLLPVSQALAPDLATPISFDDLRQDLATALDRINPRDRHASPVIVVNSDRDLERQQEDLDFDKRHIWRILVGGNKLARGFTVEGLTVSYYRRTAGQVDTLMQMGRWFGFRAGYRDLVRLYTTPDLHAMFEGACRDEEYLRRELRRYSGNADGAPQLTPKQVPPLIFQHRPDLRPTARNKMWNARLVEKSSPGEPMEVVSYPTKAAPIRRNTERWEPVLAGLNAKPVAFLVPGTSRTYDAFVGEFPHRMMIDLLSNLTWSADDTLQPELAWLRRLSPDQLARWIVLVPQQIGTESRRSILGHGPFSINGRRRESTGSLKVVSESRHRNAAQRIAGIDGGTPDPAADTLHGPATGVITLYPVYAPYPPADKPPLPGNEGDPITPDQVTIGLRIVTPLSTTPPGGRLIKWTTLDSTNPTALRVASVDAPRP